MIAVSIVSHGHGEMVQRLVAKLRACPEVNLIVLTLNIPECLPIAEDSAVRVLANRVPKGFGANHNSAFRHCSEPYFCVLNPDITLVGNPFPFLVEGLGQHPRAALGAPWIVSPGGQVEDSVRRFPNLSSLLRKALGGDKGCHETVNGAEAFCADWVAGMFMLFRSSDYAALGGFDESYYLYYEDVDICKRINLAGKQVLVCPRVQAVHDARRASHRNRRHLCWHLTSMLRFLWRYRSIA